MTSQTTKGHTAAAFSSGSIMRHIWVMTTTAAIGLLGIFIVDLIDILFLSMLGSADIVAGIGFAASILFFTISLSIGFSISMAALVSRTIGQHNIHQARRYVVNISALAFIVTSILAAIIWLNLPLFLGLLGATDGPIAVAIRYLHIILPSLPIMATGMALSAALRATGDAKLSMYCTLVGGATNALLDPLFIFVLDMGVEGAATASVFARFVTLFMAFQGINKKHRLIKRFVYQDFKDDFKAIFKISGPAMLTNLATPLGNAIVIHTMAKFGAAYVAGFAIIGRISPVAFALVFALSGAVAPIIGQNFGAGHFDRIKLTLRNAFVFNIIYVTLISIMLFLLQNPIIALFNLQGEAAELVHVFCTWIAITFIFNGTQFISNAAFNNLNKPLYATYFNIGRATLGTLPFVIIGGNIAGATGVLVGHATGGFVFASAAIILAIRHTNKLAIDAKNPQ